MNYEKLRQELGHKERTVEDLISYLDTRTNDNVPNYSLFLGAGASFTSGINTGENLVSQWREEIYRKLTKKNDYEVNRAKEYLITHHSNWYSLANEYSSLFEHKFDLPSQRRRFVEKEVDGKLPSIGYSYLVSLTKDRYFDTIYTTNFDDLLNEAFYQFSQTRPIVCAHDSSLNTISVTSNRPKIIKLHGDYLFDDIKSTLRETESLEINIKDKLIEFSKEYGLVVIGYAGNDRSIMDVINFLLKSDAYLKNGIYWCLREGDEINPELTKLLWKDRVYFVKIDGFDEVMATIHHSFKKGLSLKENFTNSKKESIIASFSADKCNLSDSSELIKSDIEDLIKHKDSMDISNLIRELNEKEFNGSEDDFKILLNVDRLIKEKNFLEAIDVINNHVENFDRRESKEVYIRKLIKIYSLANKSEDALNLCDELIDIDAYNIDNFLLKGSKYINLTERCKFIRENIDKYSNNYAYHNYMVSNGVSEYKYSKGKSFFALEILMQHINKSIGLEPSIANPAYMIKKDLIEAIYSSETDKKSKELKKKELKDLLKSVKDINNEHFTYIKLLLNKEFFDNDYDKAKSSIDYAIKVSKRSSEKIKRSIIGIVCDLYPTLNTLDGSEGYSSDWSEFIQNDLISELIKEPVSVTICKAEFQLRIERDLEKSISYIKKAAQNSNAYRYVGVISNYLINIAKEYDIAQDFIDQISEDISIATQAYHEADLYIRLKEFDTALEKLELSHKNGRSMDDYLTRKSYILLIAEKYTSVMNLVDNNIDQVISASSKDILTINRETASKKLGNSINDIALRNIIGRKLNKHLVLAAECLNGKKAHAIRLLKSAIESDYSDYYSFKSWPVIPQEYLIELELPLDKGMKNTGTNS